MTLRLACLLVLAVTGSVWAENIDPDNDGSQYAWGENVGWLNAEPGGDGGSGITVTDDALGGWMWGENAGWVSLSCADLGACGMIPYGVTNDAGTLAGYAWAENAGWISFSCANLGTCAMTPFGVAIDPQTGAFSGEAWGENIGWIRFASTGMPPFGVRTGWTCAAPSGPLTIVLDRTMAGQQLRWAAVPGAGGYDVVYGNLTTLRASAGDFAAAVGYCLSDDQTGVTYPAVPDPGSGQTFFYLVRPVSCAAGSYDSPGNGQAAPRDAGVAAAPMTCP